MIKVEGLRSQKAIAFISHSSRIKTYFELKEIPQKTAKLSENEFSVAYRLNLALKEKKRVNI